MSDDRIIIDPEVLDGKPIVRGTRLAVDFVLNLFVNGWSHQQILDNYPRLTRDDLLACLTRR